jgi:hypothetical protein
MVVEATSMQTTCGADGKWSHPLPKERSSPTQSFLGRSEFVWHFRNSKFSKNFKRKTFINSANIFLFCFIF